MKANKRKKEKRPKVDNSLLYLDFSFVKKISGSEKNKKCENVSAHGHPCLLTLHFTQ